MSDTMSGAVRQTRTAKLRVVHIDPKTAAKTAFVISLALGVATVAAAIVIWIVLAVSGVWTSVNSAVNAGNGGSHFDVTNYLGLGRLIWYAILLSAFDVVLFTAIATVSALIYNLSAILAGGIEVTFAEER